MSSTLVSTDEFSCFSQLKMVTVNMVVKSLT